MPTFAVTTLSNFCHNFAWILPAKLENYFNLMCINYFWINSCGIYFCKFGLFSEKQIPYNFFKVPNLQILSRKIFQIKKNKNRKIFSKITSFLIYLTVKMTIQLLCTMLYIESNFFHSSSLNFSTFLGVLVFVLDIVPLFS